MALEAAQPDIGLQEGQLLGDKYRLEAEIGRGAMGTVWSATHSSLGQRVAIKVISPEHADSDELRRRFDTEARAAAKLRSRFVVGVSDHGATPSGLPYIVMEFLEGECLEDRIARLGVIQLPEAARIARHVGRGLSRAHAHGIVHRDLKPANIFITKTDEDDDGDWIAKVLDFGIAKVDDFADRSTTKTGTVLGTPLFMSPEQVRGASSVDGRADLYSLGMVIYNMLTGTYAFEGQSFGDLLVSICTDPLPTLSDRAPHLPPALDAWFQKACARDPDQRFQTADELTQAFTEATGEAAPGRLSMVESSVTTLRTASHFAATYAADSSAEGAAEPGRATSSSDFESASPSTLTVTSGVFPAQQRGARVRWALGAAALTVLGGLLWFASRDGSPKEESALSAPPTELVLDEPQPPPEHAPPVAPTAAAAEEPDPTEPAATHEPQAVPRPSKPATTTSKPTTSKPATTTSKPSTTPQEPVVEPPRVKTPLPEPKKPPPHAVPDVGF